MLTKSAITINQRKINSDPHVGKILLNQQQIKNQVKELAKQITVDYEDKNPLLIGILKGAGLFLSDLVRRIKIDINIDYMAVSSYGASTKTSGIVRILKDLDEDIYNRNVIIVEDIVDSGLTLSYLLKNLSSRNPASLEVCSLLRKKGTQKLALDVKYLGFMIDDVFVVGYGLDYKQKYRNLKHVHTFENAPKNNGH